MGRQEKFKHKISPLTIDCSAFCIVDVHYAWTRPPKSARILQFSSVQSSHSVVSISLRPHGLQHARPPLSITNSWNLLKLMSIKSLMPSNHLILCRPLLLPCHPLLLSPSVFPSIRVFSNESVLRIRWPKYWSFSLNISPSNEY